MADVFPSWRYGPGGQAKIFHHADDVPAGWKDHPGKLLKPQLDHDGDGRAGGSLPKSRRKGAR